MEIPMKYATIILLLLPALLWAQEFQFRQEFDTIPVEINGWRPFVPWLGGLGGIANSIPEFCDIDADSDLDLFCGDGNTSLLYFENTGTAGSADFHFESYQFGPFNPAPYLCFADLDNDGDKDALHSYRCYYNVGSATQYSFTSSYDSLFDTSGNLLICPRMATVDINSDGDIDIFAGQYYTGQIRFYENIGSPAQYQFQLTSAAWLGIAVSGGCADPTFCDIDADGDLDLFVGNQGGRVYFYRNDGDSVNYNFTYVTDFYDSMDVGEKGSPEFADIDGDGDYDLLVGRNQQSTITSPGDIFFYENVGTAQVAEWNFITKNYISLDVGYYAQSAMSDIDADQDRDIFIQHAGDYLTYYQSAGSLDSASYFWITDNYQNISVNDAFPEFGDLDGDQDPDLLMGEAAIPGPPSIYLFQNRGTPQNASFSLYSSDYIPGIFTQFTVSNAPALADIDADGDLDLFTCDQERHFYYFQNDGSPANPAFNLVTTNWQNIFQVGTPTTQLIPLFYDVDDDSDLDLFCGMLWGWNQLWFYRNVGTPQNAQMVMETQTFLGAGSKHFTGVDIFDIDQDGDGDFLMSTYNGGMVFYRNITGEVSAPPPVQRHPSAGLQISLGPNPANPFVVASFELRVASNMSLDIFDICGRKIVELASGFHLPGEYRYVWDASKNASGIYIIRLETPQESLSEKLTIVK